MSSVSLGAGTIHLGLDVHKDSIVVGVLHPGEETAVVERIFADADSVRRLVGRLGEPARLSACYEAGPTGYELYRLLRGELGVRCEVVAPSLIPRAPGDRVKTDRRDCRRLARLHRNGDLVAVAVPSPAQEAVRDLCRTRGDVLADVLRDRHQIAGFLLRHGRPWRGGSAWTLTHRQWLAGQRFDERAATLTFAHYLSRLATDEEQLAAIGVDLARYFEVAPFAEAVHRLGAYRGITHLGALLIAAEVFDWRRFPSAAGFTAFTGLVPREHSSGASTRRGGITKTGNRQLRTHFVEAAWAYQHRASVGAAMRRRHADLDPAVLSRSWKAQQRLTARFRRITARRGNTKIAVTAVARELAGFAWAEMTAA